MNQAPFFLNLVVAATFTLTSTSALAQTADVTAPMATDMATLLQELAQPGDNDRWMRVERQIQREWDRSGSASIDYLFQRGEAALAAGQADAAVDHFSAVIDQAPDFAEAWNGRASAWFMANRLGQSLADIEQVLRLNPNHFGALAGLGTIMEQLDRPEDALAAYSASLAIHPHQASVIDAVHRLALASQGQAL